MANEIYKVTVGSTDYSVRDGRIITLEDNGTTTAGTWLAKSSYLTDTAYVDGQLFLYKITVAGASTTTLNITNSAGTALGAKTIYYQGTSKLTTHFNVGYYLILVYNSTNTCFRVINEYDSNSNTVPAAYCTTAAGTAAKVAAQSGYVALSKSYDLVTITAANTVQGAITLNINGQGAKPIYLNGNATSSSNYSLTAGTYLVYYDGTNYYFRTDGTITGSITGNAATATSATKATQDASGNTITTTYATKSEAYKASYSDHVLTLTTIS